MEKKKRKGALKKARQANLDCDTLPPILFKTARTGHVGSMCRIAEYHLNHDDKLQAAQWVQLAYLCGSRRGENLDRIISIIDCILGIDPDDTRDRSEVLKRQRIIVSTNGPASYAENLIRMLELYNDNQRSLFQAPDALAQEVNALFRGNTSSFFMMNTLDLLQASHRISFLFESSQAIPLSPSPPEHNFDNILTHCQAIAVNNKVAQYSYVYTRDILNTLKVFYSVGRLLKAKKFLYQFKNVCGVLVKKLSTGDYPNDLEEVKDLLDKSQRAVGSQAARHNLAIIYYTHPEFYPSEEYAPQIHELLRDSEDPEHLEWLGKLYLIRALGKDLEDYECYQIAAQYFERSTRREAKWELFQLILEKKYNPIQDIDEVTEEIIGPYYEALADLFLIEGMPSYVRKKLNSQSVWNDFKTSFFQTIGVSYLRRIIGREGLRETNCRKAIYFLKLSNTPGSHLLLAYIYDQVLEVKNFSESNKHKKAANKKGAEMETPEAWTQFYSEVRKILHPTSEDEASDSPDSTYSAPSSETQSISTSEVQSSPAPDRKDKGKRKKKKNKKEKKWDQYLRNLNKIGSQDNPFQPSPQEGWAIKVFDGEAFSDFPGHFDDSPRIQLLCDHILVNPGGCWGAGRPKGFGKMYGYTVRSRRITAEDRLTYLVNHDSQEVILMSWKGHYDGSDEMIVKYNQFLGNEESR